MGYFLAWLIVLIVGLTVAVFIGYSLKRKPWLATIASTLIAIWLVLPWNFDGNNYAPMFIVSVFRLVFGQDIESSGALIALTFLILASFITVVVFYTWLRVSKDRKEIQ